MIYDNLSLRTSIKEPIVTHIFVYCDFQTCRRSIYSLTSATSQDNYFYFLDVSILVILCPQVQVRTLDVRLPNAFSMSWKMIASENSRTQRICW
jgi:hypothetical protein